MNESEIYEYNEVRATGVFHGAPRFGRTDQFANVFASPNDAKDYGVGLIFIGIFILCCFLTWLAIILVFKCVGPARFGFLAGHPFTTTTSRPFHVRLTFVSAALLFIIFTVLVVVYGVTELRDTTAAVHDNNEEIQSLLRDADALANALRAVGGSSRGARDELNANLGNFCPGDANIEAQTGINFDELAGQAIALLNELDDFVVNDLVDFQANIDTAIQASQDVDSAIEQIDLDDWQSLLILIPYIMLPSILLVGVLMAWLQVSVPAITCLMSWLIMPLFVIATIAAFVGSATVSFLAVANSDMCSGGTENTPDATVMQILNNLNVNPEDTVYKAVEFYLSRCSNENPWEFIESYNGDITVANATVQELSLGLETVTVERLSLICGRDFVPMQELLQTMEISLVQLADNARGALDILACDRILPIYTDTIYGGTCSYSMTGVAWVFAASLVMAFMGMLMIMFRASLYEDEKMVDESSGPPPKDYGVDHGVTSAQSSTGSSRGDRESEIGDVYYDQSPDRSSLASYR